MARQSKEGAAAGPVPVLLTRPEAQSKAFAAALVRRFGPAVVPIVAPLMAVEPVPAALPEGRFAAVIFTSAHGVEMAQRLGWSLPHEAWCVGAKTAALARDAGFRARSADGDAAALVTAILADPPDGRLLHLSGAETRGEVADRLSAAGLPTLAVTIYRQVPQALGPEGRDLLMERKDVIVPLFSPRSAALFRAALPEGGQARLSLVAISAATADNLQGLSVARMATARRPDADAVLDEVASALASLRQP